MTSFINIAVDTTIEDGKLVSRLARTGEVVGVRQNLPVANRKNGFVEGFCHTGMDAYTLLVDSDLTMVDVRVMSVMYLSCQNKNRVEIRGMDIAARLGIKEQNVSASLRKLIAAGVIIKKSHSLYYFNARFSWRGCGQDHRDVILDYPPLTPTPHKKKAAPKSSRKNPLT